jgi:predicted GIY-YIG superfamily endonuclease
MNTHPHDNDGQLGTVYVLHFDPAYRHARHYVGWAADPDARIAAHLAGHGSPLVRAAVSAGASVRVAALIAGSRHLERRLKNWHKTGQFCPLCREARAARPPGPA